MRDGLYRLVYAGVGSSALGLFVLRNGAFTGVGQMGAHYQGRYWLEPARALYQFDGTVKFLPNTPTVTGFVAGEHGTTVPFKGELSVPDPATRFSLDLGGRAVDVAINYEGPIPG